MLLYESPVALTCTMVGFEHILNSAEGFVYEGPPCPCACPCGGGGGCRCP